MQSPFLIARIVFFGVYGASRLVLAIAEYCVSDFGLPEYPRSRDYDMAPTFLERERVDR